MQNERINLSKVEFFDSHTHIGVELWNLFNDYYPTSQDIRDLLRKLGGNNAAVVFPMPTSTYFDLKKLVRENVLVESGDQEFPYQKENSRHLRIIDSLGKDRLIPFVAINPVEKSDEQIVFLEKFLKRYAVCGLKWHTLATHASADAIEQSGFLKFAEANNLSITIHSGINHGSEFSHPLPIVQLAARYAKINFCVAHMAEFSKELFDVAKNDGLPTNLFMDVGPFISTCFKANTIYNDQVDQDFDYTKPLVALTQLVQRLPDHVLWSTDEPFTTHTGIDRRIIKNVSYEEELNLLLQLPRKLRVQISHMNPLRFLRLI